MFVQRMSGVTSPHHHMPHGVHKNNFTFGGLMSPGIYSMSCKWLWMFLRITLLHVGPSKMQELCLFKMSATPHWMTLCNFPKTWILKNNSARTSNLASLPLPLPHTLYDIILYLISSLKSSNAVTSHSSQWSRSHGQQSLSCDVPCHSD